MWRKWIILVLVLLSAAGIGLQRFFWIHGPSCGSIVLKEETTGIAVEESLSEEELVTVKKILWGKPRWPESMYGVSACGFSRKYAFLLDGTRYMMSFDRCGTLCVEDVSPGSSPRFYVDIPDTDRQALQEIFDRRMLKD